MKRFLILLIAVTLAGLSYAQVLTCYDVQFTNSADGNSPYLNQVVTVEGIVVAEKFYTGTNTSNYGFVISDPEGGPWSGLLIFTNRYFPQVGDRVSVTGSIAEYYEFTEMTSLSAYSVISTGNTLPPRFGYHRHSCQSRHRRAMGILLCQGRGCQYHRCPQ
jgi:predicted extracellular nuclease